MPKNLSLCHFWVCHIINNILLSSSLRNSHQHRTAWIKFSRIADSLTSNFECKNFPEDEKPSLSFPPSMTDTIGGGVIMQPCPRGMAQLQFSHLRLHRWRAYLQATNFVGRCQACWYQILASITNTTSIWLSLLWNEKSLIFSHHIPAKSGSL